MVVLHHDAARPSAPAEIFIEVGQLDQRTTTSRRNGQSAHPRAGVSVEPGSDIPVDADRDGQAGTADNPRVRSVLSDAGSAVWRVDVVPRLSRSGAAANVPDTGPSLHLPVDRRIDDSVRGGFPPSGAVVAFPAGDVGARCRGSPVCPAPGRSVGSGEDHVRCAGLVAGLSVPGTISSCAVWLAAVDRGGWCILFNRDHLSGSGPKGPLLPRSMAHVRRGRQHLPLRRSARLCSAAVTAEPSRSLAFPAQRHTII